MELPLESPLVQQARPDTFEPKVVGLYRRLFQEVDDEGIDDAFWTTLFLLKPDVTSFKEILDNTDANFLLHVQHQTQQLVLQALSRIKAEGPPADENALDTLALFFSAVLSKKFTNPSSDVIEVVAGLDSVDSVFFDLVDALDHVIKDGRSTELRQSAVNAAISVVAGGYQTALVSYFVHRDFFPALMKLVYQLENPLTASRPLLLTGLLANYNKFEMNNQYRARFADFVNQETMARVIQSIAWTTTVLRERYVAIQDDTPSVWSISNTLSYVGLGTLTGAKKPAAPALSEDQQKEAFSQQPGTEVATLLTLYDFVLANKLLCGQLISTAPFEKAQESPFSAFLSCASYLAQHAYRSSRPSLYAYLTLLVLLILVEDPTTAKLLYDHSASVRLCRQKPPHLPLSKSDRPYIASMVDLVTDGINHNLRKRLDVKYYRQSVAILNRIVAYLTRSRSKLTYHWAELWRSLLSFARFLTTYGDDLKVLPGIYELAEAVSSLLAASLTNGEAFLPDPAAYDDLFYKLVEAGEALVKFRDAYDLTKSGQNSSINTLVGVSKHYQELIATQQSKSAHLTPREVNRIIKQGYETLSIETKEESLVDGYREVDHKVELKKIARIAVLDAASLVS